MHAHLERAGRRGERRKRPDELARERTLRQRIHGGDRVARRRGIRRVGLDQHRRPLAANQGARKTFRNRDHELHGARREHPVDLGIVARFADEVEILAVRERRHDAARELAAVRIADGRRHVLRIGVDREAEQHELEHRNADDHREREPVAPKLDEFLADDAPPPRPGEDSVHGSSPARASLAPRIRWMNTSSRPG